MEILDGTILCMSTPNNWWNEKRVKRNTIMEIGIDDVNKYDLDVKPDGSLWYTNEKGDRLIVTQIEVVITGDHCFSIVEQLLNTSTYISRSGDVIWIFSW